MTDKDKYALKPENFYHTAIVVRDVEAAKAEMAAASGFTWGLQGEVDMPMITDRGPELIHIAFAYSKEGPPYLEIVSAVDDTMFACEGHGRAHHIGYWCDDMEATAAYLDRIGVTRTATVGVQSLDEHANWIMFRTQSGLDIELVDASLREGFELGIPPPM